MNSFNVEYVGEDNYYGFTITNNGRYIIGDFTITHNTLIGLTLGLENIKKLINAYPNCIIGSSDHFNGILSGPVAYMEGARVFEKHVTLNRSWVGTDHSFALERGGFTNFVRDIKRVPLMMPTKPIGPQKAVTLPANSAVVITMMKRVLLILTPKLLA